MQGSQSQTHHKVVIHNIKIVAQMCNEYPIREAMAIQRRKRIWNETWSDVEFLNLEHNSLKMKNFELSTEHSQGFINVFTHMRRQMWS